MITTFEQALIRQILAALATWGLLVIRICTFKSANFFRYVGGICNDKPTGAKNGRNDDDRNHLRPSEAPGYMAFFQLMQIVI